MQRPGVTWFRFSCVCGEGQAEGFQLQHSLLSYRCACLSGSWQEGEELLTNFGVKVDFSYHVEVRGTATVVTQKL